MTMKVLAGNMPAIWPSTHIPFRHVEFLYKEVHIFDQ